MPENEKYTVTVYVAAPGTPLTKEGPGATSEPGHMYYTISNGTGKPESFGFTPIKHGSIDGLGFISRDDVENYKDPYYSRTMDISKSQYDKFKEFGNHPDKQGFNMYYEDVRNNCVDFTWGALNHAGIQRTLPVAHDKSIPLNGKGAYRPAETVDDIRSIKDPIPGSPLNKEHTHPMPTHRSLLQHVLSENEQPDIPGATIASASPLTKDSPTHDLFEALYQASIKNDDHAFHVVAQTYLQSNDGQAFLQQGRDFNQQQDHAQAQAAQQAQAQQVAMAAPVMVLADKR